MIDVSWHRQLWRIAMHWSGHMIQSHGIIDWQCRLWVIPTDKQSNSGYATIDLGGSVRYWSFTIPSAWSEYLIRHFFSQNPSIRLICHSASLVVLRGNVMFCLKLLNAADKIRDCVTAEHWYSYDAASQKVSHDWKLLFSSPFSHSSYLSVQTEIVYLIDFSKAYNH
jgi:hypothetical protein